MRRARADYPWKEGGQEWIEVGRWLHDKAPGAVTMTRNPWELHYYSQQKAVQIPLGQLDDIFRVARHYGATHLIPDDVRPGLEPWLNGEVPGLRQVFESEGVTVYEIDPEALSSIPR
jgi:hypothetical protein